MTMPSPVPIDDPLYWQKKKKQQDQAQQATDQATMVNPVADRMIDSQGAYKQGTNTVRTIGASANASVAGSLQTQQKARDKEQQRQFQEQQKAAMAAMQTQQAGWQSEMNQKYANQFNAQQQGQNDQWNAYRNYGSGAITGAQYTGQASQIAQLARQAGFPESAIPMAVAVAMAESGGKADAINNANRNGSTDRGLMQINSVHSGLLSKHNWADPEQNMQMAYQIWQDAGGKWTPWSTYNSGAVNQYMSLGQKAASAVQPAYIQPFNSTTPTGQLRTTIVARAQSYTGLPYQWGGTDLSKAVDCSGLVQSVYKQFGIQMPRVANDQAHAGIKTSISNLQPGDLVAWAGNRAGQSASYVGHIAIYAGNGQIVEAQQDGVPVHTRTLGRSENVYGVHLTNLDRGPGGIPR